MKSNLISNKWRVIKPFIALTGGLMGLILALLTINVAHAADPVLTRHPFIAKQSLTSTTIIWHTDVATTSRLDYGPTLTYGLAITNTTPITTHVFTLTNLMTNTKYFYQAIAGGATMTAGSDYYFETEKSPTFTFVTFGDGGTGGSNARAIASRIREISPNFVIHTGDVYHQGWSCDPPKVHYQCSFYNVYSQTLKNVPFYVTPGDHDYDDLPNNEYMQTFAYLYTSTVLTDAYYAVEYGNALFITINTDVSNPHFYEIGSPMYNWLEQQLNSSTKFWKFVYFDKPLYMSGYKRSAVGGGHTDERGILSPLFERYNVDIIFGGDAHLYERSLPINEFYPSSRGVVYIVTGGGGANLHAPGWDWWTAYARSDYHIVQIDVNDCSLTLQAIDRNGAVFDTYTIDRCPA
ncbi:MAG: hypothetical protein GY869_14040 [Planctomycetes bacterium]|nr:hypothetical protein [Planctomycetota bacterium]